MRNLFRKEPSYVSVPGQARAAPEAQVGDGLWVRCDNERCRELLYVREFENNLKVCHKCEHHARLSARERIQQLTDDGSFVEHDCDQAFGFYFGGIGERKNSFHDCVWFQYRWREGNCARGPRQSKQHDRDSQVPPT